MRSRRSRFFTPDPDAPGRPCDVPGCAAAGEYRAPRSRHALREFLWLCLDHVRTYNAEWDYYKGMSTAQIEAELRADLAWQRPSWPLGHGGSASYVHGEQLRNAFGDTTGMNEANERRGRSAPPPLRDALRVLGLSWPVTLAAVKARYKELAKRHHPDANGGDRSAEERLKAINLAYATLRTQLAGEVRAS